MFIRYHNTCFTGKCRPGDELSRGQGPRSRGPDLRHETRGKGSSQAEGLRGSPESPRHSPLQQGQNCHAWTRRMMCIIREREREVGYGLDYKSWWHGSL